MLARAAVLFVFGVLLAPACPGMHAEALESCQTACADTTANPAVTADPTVTPATDVDVTVPVPQVFDDMVGEVGQVCVLPGACA